MHKDPNDIKFVNIKLNAHSIYSWDARKENLGLKLNLWNKRIYA